MINLSEKKEIDSTDVDLLVIVKDNCSVTIFNKIKQSLPAIEGVFFSRYREDEISFFKGFQSATGMFVNELYADIQILENANLEFSMLTELWEN